MRKLRVLDLFSGIGGFSLGLERTQGFETVAFCEIEPFCRKVLRKHWPNVPCDEDITKREFSAGEADIICGGFPCQDISYAGEGTGLAGERSGLWRELFRAIRVVRPLYALVENVAAILNRGLGDVLGDLASVGYDTEWHCLPACAFGADHIRDRTWILANPECDSVQGRTVIAAAWKKESREKQLPGLLLARLGDEVSAARVWRDDHGVQSRLDKHRNRAIGNAVYPKIPAFIGHAILEARKLA